MTHPQIAAFARLAEENTAPIRRLEGQKTLLGRTVHDFAYDPIHDEIVVGNSFAQAILTFRGGASGEEPPIRVIQGPHTRIVSQRALDKVTVDPINDEIFVSTSANNILVFPREAHGDVAPIRVLGGVEVDPRIGARPPMRVDPVRDLLIVGDRDRLLIFDRTASGNARPRAIIPGPSAGGHQFALYPPTGMVITNRSGTIEGWSLEEALRLYDSGDQSTFRPRWRSSPTEPLVGRNGRGGGSGIALNPVDKEIIIASGSANTVWTFFVPEAFEEEPSQTGRQVGR